MKEKRSLTTFILPSRCLLFSPSNNSPTIALTIFCWQCNAMQFNEKLLHLVSSSASKFKQPNISCNSISWRSRFLRGGLTICGGWQEARQLRGRRGDVHPATPCAPHTSLYPCTPPLPSTSLTLALPCDAYRPGHRGPLTHETGRGGEGYFKSRASGSSSSKSLVLPSKAFSWRYKLAHFIFDHNDEAEKVKTSITSIH